MRDNKIKGKRWLDKLDQTVAENSKLSLFLLFQFLTIGLLIIGYMKMIDKIEVNVELPETIREVGVVTVGKEYANKKFFDIWGREDVETISSFNQKDIKEKMDYLRQRMYPPYYYKNELLLKNYEKEISTDLVTQKFTFAKEDIKSTITEDGHQATVLVEGFYSKMLDEDMVIKAEKCIYKLGYIIKGGHIYVESFKTTCK